MIRLAITDDHLLILEGFKTMISGMKDLSLDFSFSTANELLTSISSIEIDVLLLDINLPDGNGIELCKILKKDYPNLKIIALTNFEETSFVKQMIKNGASGYLLKNSSKEEISSAINAVFKYDEVYIPDSIKKKILAESFGKKNQSFVPKLTRREKEVLELVSKELTNEEIADKLFVTIKTIEAHRSNLLQKMGVKNTAGLIRVAFEKGLL
jgi:DNA-binding NarL/FixJ family response regulator